MCGVRDIDGVVLASNSGNKNSGIDLGDDGATANANDAADADAGPNNLQNFPDPTSAELSGSSLTLVYSVDSDTMHAGYSLRVEFFEADSDAEEGKRYVGFDAYSEGEWSVCGAGNEPCSNTATIAVSGLAVAGSAEIAKVVSIIGCDTVGTVSEPPYMIEWSVSPPGSHFARATVFDTKGRFSSDTVSVTIEAAVSVDGSDTDWIALGVDPVVDTDGLQTDLELALDRLLFYQDSANYYFGFDAGARSKRVAFGLYLDLNAARVDQMTDPVGRRRSILQPTLPTDSSSSHSQRL